MKSKGPFLVAQAPPAIAGRPPLPAPGDRLFYRQGARLLCGVFILLTWLSASAQNPPDSSAPKQDTIVPVTVVSVADDSAKAPHSKKKILPKKLDTLLATAVPATRRDFTQQFGGEPPDGWFRAALARNSYFNFLGQALAPLAQIHLRQGFDLLFYFLAALLFYFALIKLFFWQIPV